MGDVRRGAAVPELTEVIARRRELGQDRLDEIWEGVYRVTPGPSVAHALVDDQLTRLLHPYAVAAGLVGCGNFNLGEPNDYRVPDHGYHRSLSPQLYVPTAAVVVEILSPGDHTWDKLGFYAAHGVDEVLVADPDARTIRFWVRQASGLGYDEVGASALLRVTAPDLTAQITWP
jgi:Uma2 family endonuclease